MTSFAVRYATVNNMKDQPDFFLSAAGEMIGDLAISRACWTRGRLSNGVRNDHMLIEVDPPVIGQVYGLGDRDITSLIISARYQDSTLFPVSEWPCHVYIARILDDGIVSALAFAKDQIQVIAWGGIFSTVEESLEAAPPSSKS